MPDIKTIVFGTDFSDGSIRACEMARTLTSLTGARLHVLHVITELVDKHRRSLTADVVDTLVREIERHAVEDMHQFCDAHFADLDTETDIVIGVSHEELVKKAIAVDADLIIMGTHGRTGLEKLFVGSTAEKVVRTSPIPVLTVRE